MDFLVCLYVFNLYHFEFIMKALVIFIIGFLVYLGNNGFFFFSEEFLIAFSLVLFFILIVSMLKGLFIRSFFMEVKAIYTIFYYLFMLI